jgi:hypothetical protein
MRFEDLLEIVDREPVFETGLLLAGDVDPADVRRQLSRCRFTASELCKTKGQVSPLLASVEEAIRLFG